MIDKVGCLINDRCKNSINNITFFILNSDYWEIFFPCNFGLSSGYLILNNT